MNQSHKFAARMFVVVLLGLIAAAAEAEHADVAIAWNDHVLQVAESEDGFLTLKGLRTTAMMHLAMHDALNTINPAFDRYVYDGVSPGANPVAAVSAAAYEIATSQYPDQSAVFDELRDRWQSAALSESGAAGAALGRAAAAAVLAARDGDGWDREAEYNWHPMAPGVYAEFHEHSGTPQGFIFGAGWARARGFALTTPDEFRAPPPPDIESYAYVRAFDEVKKVGRFQSMVRTADQTHLALWWKDFAENSHNRLARDLIQKEDLSLSESIRLLALVNMAIFDAYISSFDNKFHYNFWRPYTAIRWADNDGNPDTVKEATWTNLHRHTYAFPSYPSAHGTACAAAMQAFTEVFGDNYSFDMRTSTVDIAGPFSGKIDMQPPIRSFDRFSDAANECGLSRIFLGIHFRFDSIEGVHLGNRVGAKVVETMLKPRADSD